MAASASPQMSPSNTMTAPQRFEREQSDTPPPQPLSKRDKRRGQLLDRLQDMTNAFRTNKDQHYRSQLQAIQLDIGLIMHSSPYARDPIGELVDAVEPMVFKIKGASDDAITAIRENKVEKIAGKLYSEFANEVIDAMEYRDTALTTANYEYSRRVQELKTSNEFMTKLAEEEHKALASTLRDRLINSVTGRKARLNKDKDIETIAETNALLMHPNQFSITNPASPGGALGKRATRHRQQVDDLPSLMESHKRKRRAADDAGSPIPSRRLLENGFSTPIWTTEQVAKAVNKGTGSPLYSIDKLFTEKELTMTYNQAAMAAHQYMVRHKADGYGSGSPTNGASDSNSGDGELHRNDDDNDNEDSPATAPAMDRQFSHATRSTRGLAGNGAFTTPNGIDVIAEHLLPINFSRQAAQMPKMPPPLASIMQKAYVKDVSNGPLGVVGEDLALDLQRMDILKKINEMHGPGRSLDVDNGDREVLEAALAEPGNFVRWNRAPKETVRAKASHLDGLQDTFLGGVPMSKQSSMSEMGGVPMSRGGTQDGSRRGRRRGA